MAVSRFVNKNVNTGDLIRAKRGTDRAGRYKLDLLANSNRCLQV